MKASLAEFLHCVRSQGTPKCPVDAAFSDTAACLMSVESHRPQWPVRCDAAKEARV